MEDSPTANTPRRSPRQKTTHSSDPDHTQHCMVCRNAANFYVRKSRAKRYLRRSSRKSTPSPRSPSATTRKPATTTVAHRHYDPGESPLDYDNSPLESDGAYDIPDLGPTDFAFEPDLDIQVFHHDEPPKIEDVTVEDETDSDARPLRRSSRRLASAFAKHVGDTTVAERHPVYSASRKRVQHHDLPDRDDASDDGNDVPDDDPIPDDGTMDWALDDDIGGFDMDVESDPVVEPAVIDPVDGTRVEFDMDAHTRVDLVGGDGVVANMDAIMKAVTDEITDQVSQTDDTVPEEPVPPPTKQRRPPLVGRASLLASTAPVCDLSFKVVEKYDVPPNVHSYIPEIDVQSDVPEASVQSYEEPVFKEVVKEEMPAAPEKEREQTASKKNASRFENSVLDLNVDIRSFKHEKDKAKNVVEADGTGARTGTQLVVSHKGGALARSGKDSDDWRSQAVSATARDPIVPHQDSLSRIRSNYKLKELAEEDYVGCMETIIERDYFPDIVRLRLTNARMEARLRGDEAGAARIQEQLDSFNMSQEINVRLKTVNNENLSVNVGKGGLKLDEFNKIFTSEDNRSFGRLMEKTILKGNKQTSWMEDGERRHNLALADTQAKTNLGIQDKHTLTNRAVSRNAFFFNQTDPSAAEHGEKPRINTSNTSMPNDHSNIMRELDEKQRLRRTDKLKTTHQEKVNDLITQYGLRECSELVDDEHRAKFDYVHTPLSFSGANDGYRVPRPIPREQLAEKLRKKYLSAAAGTPSAKTPMCRTPLLVQRLIAKHKSGADLELRSSYGSSKFSKGSVRSSAIFNR